MDARLAILVAALLGGLVACEPQPGDPCEPGGPLVTRQASSYEEAIDRCFVIIAGSGGSVGSCSLTCTGPPGCEGEADFHWQWAGPNYLWTWCGCDGQTHVPISDDDGQTESPSTRWQWWGTCEDPCAGVYLHDRYGWGWGPYGAFGPDRFSTPAAPQCARCIGARPLPDDTCVGPDGEPVSLDCCARCANATVGAGGVCVDGETGAALSPLCCG